MPISFNSNNVSDVNSIILQISAAVLGMLHYPILI